MVRIRSVFATRVALLQLCGFVEAATWSEVTFSGTAPTARSYHTAVWSEAANGMYIFGGTRGSSRLLNDLHFFDRQAATWSEVTFTGTAPTVRRAHTAVWSEAANGMYIFGGTDGWVLNDLYFFDRQAATWSEVTFSGTAPTARYLHTAVWSEAANGMYIFGGDRGYSRYLNDLHFFDRQAATWSEVTFSGTAPTGREDHTAVWSEAADGMYIFGGRDGSGCCGIGSLLNELHFFDRQAATWSIVTFSGTAPTARYAHTAVWSEAANGMYIFGGRDANGGSNLNDLHFFDRQAAMWSEVSSGGTAPTARDGHAAVWSEAANGMYIFGGSLLNDLHFFDRQTSTSSTTSSTSSTSSTTSSRGVTGTSISQTSTSSTTSSTSSTSNTTSSRGVTGTSISQTSTSSTTSSTSSTSSTTSCRGVTGTSISQTSTSSTTSSTSSTSSTTSSRGVTGTSISQISTSSTTSSTPSTSSTTSSSSLQATMRATITTTWGTATNTRWWEWDTTYGPYGSSSTSVAQVVFLGSLQFTLDGATEAQVTTAVELTLAIVFGVPRSSIQLELLVPQGRRLAQMRSIPFAIVIEHSRAAQASAQASFINAKPEDSSENFLFFLRAELPWVSVSNLTISVQELKPKVEGAQEESSGSTFIIIVILVVLACAVGAGIVAWHWRQNKTIVPEEEPSDPLRSLANAQVTPEDAKPPKKWHVQVVLEEAGSTAEATAGSTAEATEAAKPQIWTEPIYRIPPQPPSSRQMSHSRVD